MNTISSLNTASMLQASGAMPLRGIMNGSTASLKELANYDSPKPISLHGQQGHSAAEVKEKFTQFVGEAFYGQMFKAMRSTVGPAPYFNGGQAEKAFQGQLDQTMSQELTKTTASTFADPMFARQFPHLANAEKQSSGLGQLSQLSRR